MSILDDVKEFGISESLEGWVMSRVDEWKDYYVQNHQEKHDEYDRIWRGVWEERDKSRASERSRLISPATQQAIESSVAELEEATFGRGRWFDIEDDDPERQDVEFLKNKLYQDFQKQKVRKAVAECLLTAAVKGNGIGEIVLETIKEMTPATQPVMDGQMTAVGVNIRERTVVKLRPIQLQNFRIDPSATSIDSGLGCAIDEYVPTHQIEMLIEEGIYKEVVLGSVVSDLDLMPDKNIDVAPRGTTRKTTYYGLVPRHLLKEAKKEKDNEEVVSLVEGEDDDDYYVEAIVVLANGGDLLKAEENPYMMQDRPVIAFSWDTVPGKFQGRGVAEKAYNSQKALDAELRARQDALAITVHPMIGIDSTRIPRGMTAEVRPGKTILTVGRPSEIIEPVRLGAVDQITFAQAESLQRMLQMATGAVDSAGIPGSINGEATAAGISMSLGAIIKRHKRTLINFQESFLIPFVEKAAWRYMQFDPENYPVSDYQFIATSSLGIIAREYEVTQLVQLLQTMSAESPLYPILIMSIIDNMGVSNREQLKAALEAAGQPSPEAQQAQQATIQADLAFKASQTAALNGQAAESNARALKYTEETRIMPLETAFEQLSDTEEKRLKLADTLLKERQVAKTEIQ